MQQALPEHQVHAWDEGRPSGQAQMAVVWAPPTALFQHEPRLTHVFNLGAGVDALLPLPGMPDDITLVRMEDGGMAVQMAEYVLHYLVRVSRDLDRYAELQAQACWRPLPDIDRDAWSVGVMGAGVMGARVAQACAALDYPVAVWSRSGRPVPGAQVYAADQLDQFLARTRVLVNVLPLTDQTQGILSQALFDQLLPDAYLINIARGAHLVESDLLASLQAGRLRGAALDVFAQEPLPAHHAFWHDRRIHVTPHVAGASLLSLSVQQIADKIQALGRGEAITGVVDRSRQY
ncbi:glyoxylate/hydroxypyruvate reductase A [Castellaniella sp.]|uniref:2-hydroxyacid dehydrogenase n=1 Tax=Castellaniella sp. TaxID=1955812 RepID=UPI002AFFB776|nr:glyoxylate/hydroxypyruvate reductase A [Castellaniella sp.]